MQNENNRDRRAVDDLFSAIYEELRRLAFALRRNEYAATLNPTALVNEAWLKLAASPGFDLDSPLHFKRIAARASCWSRRHDDASRQSAGVTMACSGLRSTSSYTCTRCPNASSGRWPSSALCQLSGNAELSLLKEQLQPLNGSRMFPGNSERWRRQSMNRRHSQFRVSFPASVLGLTMGIRVLFRHEVIAATDCRDRESFPGHGLFHILASVSTIRICVHFAT